MATSKDVSILAGVSRATVSHVINKSGYVSPALSARVESAIRELGYRPHAIARSLVSRKTYTVGIVVAQLSSAFYPHLLSGIERTLVAEGYSVLLGDSHEDSATERASLEALAERRVDGIIWVPGGEKNAAFVRKLRESGIAVVVMDRRISGDDLDSVSSANEDAGYMATRYLHEQGYRRIAIVTFSPSLSPARDRFNGYRRALAELSLPFEKDLAMVIENTEGLHTDAAVSDGSRKALRLFQGDSRPEAVIACSDLLTLSVVHAARTSGKRIPNDVAVLGFDDSPWGAFVDPPLSSVVQETVEMGTQSARILLRRLQEKPKQEQPPVHVELPVHLIRRRSCGET